MSSRVCIVCDEEKHKTARGKTCSKGHFTCIDCMLIHLPPLGYVFRNQCEACGELYKFSG